MQHGELLRRLSNSHRAEGKQRALTALPLQFESAREEAGQNGA
jgi:hypothetical protein